MVRFCPRCGSLLVPFKKEGNIYLKCSKCGYETKSGGTTYGMKYQVESSKRVSTAKATEAREAKLSPEEREMLQEYYEVFLEEFAQEEVGEYESD
ncbi:MAG: DNA-directed RNA polymerase subunit M [Desulfurococcaceae archaeon]